MTTITVTPKEKVSITPITLTEESEFHPSILCVKMLIGRFSNRFYSLKMIKDVLNE
jgi:hypothetical protein